MEEKLYRICSFQITKNNDSYKYLMDLCLKSNAIYNNVLFILRNLYFASHPKTGKSTEYYLDNLGEDLKKYVVSEIYNYKDKDGCDKSITFYELGCVNEKSGKYYRGLYALFMILPKINTELYKTIQCTPTRCAIKLAYDAMDSFKKSIIRYYKNPSKFLGKPKLPYYVKNEDTTIKKLTPFINNSSEQSFKISKSGNYIIINGDVHLKNVYVPDSVKNIKEVRVVPKLQMGMFNVELVYTKNKKTSIDTSSKTNVMAIDLGVDIFAAITDTNGCAILIDGKYIKGINNRFNYCISKINREYSKHGIYNGKKKRECLKKRFNAINTWMDQLVSFIIDKAISGNCGLITIGLNNGWKQKLKGEKDIIDGELIITKKAKMNRKNRQIFTYIPFDIFINKLKSKGEEYGIEVITINESYTSRCSALENEELCHHDKYLGVRSGRHRKRFVTGDKRLIHADINGSLNILRKASGRDIDFKGNFFNPIKISNIGGETFQTWVQKQSDNKFVMDYISLNKGKYIETKATVDSHNVEKSSLKKENS